MSDEIPRIRQARLAAEKAMVRIVHHYGEKPEFVLGGLVPELRCSGSDRQHAGTTDIDVEVDPEIECDAVNSARPERALRNAEFEPDSEQVWRWRAVSDEVRAEVKFDLLACLEHRGDLPAAIKQAKIALEHSEDGKYRRALEDRLERLTQGRT